MNRHATSAVVALVVAVLVSAWPTFAEAMRGSGGFPRALACLVAGGSSCTMTGGIVISGVTTDITTSGNEDLTMVAAGTGDAVITGGDDTIINVANGQMAFSGSASRGMLANTANLAAGMNFPTGGSGGPTLGSTGSGRPVTEPALCGGDNIAPSSADEAWCAYAGGKTASLEQQSSTCADSGDGNPGALALDLTSDVVYVTNSDADGCVATIAETSAITGSTVRIVVVSSAGGVVTFADVANGVVADASCDTTGLGANGVAVCDYINAANDFYLCFCTPLS